MYINWEILAPFVAKGQANPFEPFLFLSHRIPTSSPEDPRYAKGYLDLVFVAYHVIFFSFVRQTITISLCWPLARYFGIKKQAKLDRFGEQGYALIYFAALGAWGVVSCPLGTLFKTWLIQKSQRIMSQLPTWWYRTENFWIDYPHWNMNPELKRYYLMHSAYWCQQLLVLLMGLEKPRKDYAELVAHHFVTLWMVGFVPKYTRLNFSRTDQYHTPRWSYLINLTLFGNAVYMSMDIPDAFLAVSWI